MEHLKIFSTLAFVVFHLSSADVTYRQGPQYTINCLENGDVEIKGLTLNSYINPTSNSKCMPNSTTTKATVIVPKDCLNSTDLKVDRTVTVKIIDSTFDGNTQTPTPNTVPDLVGGQRGHTITIKCTKLSEGGMNVQVVHGIKVETATISRPDSINDVVMYLKADKFDDKNKIMTLPDITSVYIGDKYYMYLVYRGSADYAVIPKMCKAYGSSFASQPTQENRTINLLNRNNSCVSANSQAYRIMHNFQMAENVARAEMYGFRFNSDEEVTFVCDVTVCRKDIVSCKLQKCTTSGSFWPIRSRRSAEAENNEQYKVTKTIRVISNRFKNSAGLPVYSGFLATIVFVIQMIISL